MNAYIFQYLMIMVGLLLLMERKQRLDYLQIVCIQLNYPKENMRLL